MRAGVGLVLPGGAERQAQSLAHVAWGVCEVRFRMAWAMMVRGERFNEPKLLPAAA